MEWLLPTPIVSEGLSSDFNLTPITSYPQEAFDPSGNAYKLSFDTTASLCDGDDWLSEAIGRTRYPGPDFYTLQGEVLSDGMKDPRDTATLAC